MSEVLSPEQAAKILGCSVLTVIRRLRRGEIKGAKPGREWRTTAAALANYVERPRAVSAPTLKRGRRKPLVNV